MLDGLTKWLNAMRVTDAPKAMRDQDGRKVMTTYAKEQGIRLIECLYLYNQA